MYFVTLKPKQRKIKLNVFTGMNKKYCVPLKAKKNKTHLHIFLY